MNVCYTQRDKQITKDIGQHCPTWENCFRLNNFVHETYDGTHVSEKRNECTEEEREKEREIESTSTTMQKISNLSTTNEANTRVVEKRI